MGFVPHTQTAPVPKAGAFFVLKELILASCRDAGFGTDQRLDYELV
jgi:hypothetical protein